VIPLVALCMTSIVMMVAIVVGLAATRSLRREARSAADVGATAGALSVRDRSGTAKQCTEAMGYTFLNLQGTQPSSSDITTACAGMTGTCSTATRTATITVDATTVTVTNPVLDTSSLMNGTGLGTGISQPADATADGASCDRVGVEITRPQSDLFSGIFGSDPRTYTVHSVAKYSPGGTGARTPALAALNQTACNAIDAGNGYIYLLSNTTDAGLAVSDSNGALCSSGNTIMNGGSSGQICAQSAGSLVGQVHWYQAANSIGYNTSASVYSATPATCGSAAVSGYRYVGSLGSIPSRTTRAPVDNVYHCTNVPTSVQTLCTTADPISTLQTLSTSSSSSPPTGYTTWSSPCSTQSAAVTLPTGNVWVNCPTFTVKGNALNIPGGSNVIFNGAVSVEANGFLKANTDGSADSNGYPVPTNSALQTTLIMNSTAAEAFNVQSTSSNVALAQTAVYSAGGVTISGSPIIRWTPPTATDPSAGGLKSLMYWSESTQQLALSGSPSIFAKGVMFQGNGKLSLSGSGLIDLQKVQVWVDTIGISGSGGVKLSYDPDNSVSTALAATSLIR
jgi:hypothetical protein